MREKVGTYIIVNNLLITKYNKNYYIKLFQFGY